jgi:hypothetical protein
MERPGDTKVAPCPTCAARFPTAALPVHVWEAHRQLFDGHRARNPWEVIEEWLEQHRRRPNDELVARSRSIAQVLDPKGGLGRLHRRMLAMGVDDEAARQMLLGEADASGSSLCPRCFAQVPADDAAVPPLNAYRGRLSFRGYRVEVFDRGIFTRVEIDMPDKNVLRAREPRRQLTWQGTLFMAGAPPVLVAVVLLFVCVLLRVPPLWPVLACLALAAATTAIAWLSWREPPPLRDRAVDYAWEWLVPILHADGYRPTDAAFLASLAQASVGSGRPSRRSSQLDRLIEAAETARKTGQARASHLANLHALRLADEASQGSDLLPQLTPQLRRVFKGELPLVFASDLLNGLKELLARLPAMPARLRTVICDLAFEAGFEVRDLVELSTRFPSLGDVLHVADPDGLARLRLLWSLRPSRPWSRCGKASTVFEIAVDADAARKHLAKHPDLLLIAWDVPGIYLCGDGLSFHDVVFRREPRQVEVKPRGKLKGGYELWIDDADFFFTSDPTELIAPLERWFRFWFRDFTARVSSVFTWKSPGVAAAIHDRDSVVCSSCGALVLPRCGEIGVLRPAVVGSPGKAGSISPQRS